MIGASDTRYVVVYCIEVDCAVQPRREDAKTLLSNFGL